MAATLADLEVSDFERCERSTNGPRGGHELVWVFTPASDDGLPLWVRLVERGGVVVVSFHIA